MSQSVRERQIASIKRMLNFNQPVTKATNTEPQWKVLIYDRCGQDIISPLFSVKELRDSGITLHQLINSQRESIPDVPAIYFILPTEENIARISKDLGDSLYESYYFNFITAVSRNRLEELAHSAIAANAVTQISRVYDQYLNFISLEDEMFSLRPADPDSISYYNLNKADVKDTDMDITVNAIVDGLFSYFVTLGALPIIRCPRGNAAEMVAERLDKRLRENYRDPRNSLFGSDNTQNILVSLQRPLLVLLDRNIDLATPLHHTWTYQALAHDVLKLNLNKLEIPNEGAGKAASKIYDMDSQKDTLWSQHRGSPFPEVAEAIQNELEDYKGKEGRVTQLKQAMSMEDDDDGAALSLLSDNTVKLTAAMSTLPELLMKKRNLDSHTSIATELLNRIKSRKLDLYFETEEKLMSSSALEDTSLMSIIQDTEAGLNEDKLRLLLIALICDSPSGSTAHVTDTDIDTYTQRIETSLISAVKYVRRWRTYAKIQSGAYSGGGSTKSVGMFGKLMSQASNFAMEGVKNLVVKKHKLPVTKFTDNLMELKSSPETDSYRYFDPKQIKNSDSMSRTKSTFMDAVVFVVGGGNYIEYQNLLDYAKGTKHVVYGCSQLQNADQFLQQLAKLGDEMN